jgi:hypothetical protein
VRRLAAAVGLTAPAAAAVASADPAPIPVRAPTGYRDYCTALQPSQRKRLCPRGGVPQALWRPLHLPTVAAGAACPVSRARVLRGLGPVFGTGPVSITHVDPWRVQFPAPQTSLAAGSGWGIDKTPFVLGKRSSGPFAVRGGRIDGAGALGFSGPRGKRPFEAIQYPGDRQRGRTAGYRSWPVGVWMTAPGCYALQVDGAAFTRVIVFRVEPATG